jgi:L-asparaginase II
MMSLFLQKEHRLYPLTEKIWSACVQHPDCFGGERSLVTEVMKVAGSDVLIKNGAEGVYFFASKKHEIVVALKVRDGATRASEAAVLALLNHYLGFDLNTSYFSEKLSLRNWAKTTIGEIQVVLDPNVH